MQLCILLPLRRNQRHAGIYDTDTDTNYSFEGTENRAESFVLFFVFFLCSEGVCGALSWACFCTDNIMPARWTYHRWVRVRPRFDIISERAGGSFVTCLKGDTWNPPCYLQIPPLKPQTAQHKQQHNRQQRRRITLPIADPLHLCYTAVWVLMWAIMQNEKPNSQTHTKKKENNK